MQKNHYAYGKSKYLLNIINYCTGTNFNRRQILNFANLRLTVKFNIRIFFYFFTF